MPLILLLLAALVARMGPASPEQTRAAFPRYLADALAGNFAPSDTGLNGATTEALDDLATAAATGQPTAELEAAARKAFEAEMR